MALAPIASAGVAVATAICLAPAFVAVVRTADGGVRLHGARANASVGIYLRARSCRRRGRSRIFNDIRDTGMVIGVVGGGRSRAYFVRYLAYHHILNEQLGQTELRIRWAASDKAPITRYRFAEKYSRHPRYNQSTGMERK